MGATNGVRRVQTRIRSLLALEQQALLLVEPAAGSECWRWLGSHNKSGYGLFRSGERQYRAHRLVWQATHHGPIPDGMNVCHRCDNPGCVNPDHLFIGSQRDNLADMTAKGRRRSTGFVGRAQHGEHNPHAKLTADDVREIRRLRSEGVQARVIAEQFGLHIQGVYRLASKKRWAHLD